MIQQLDISRRVTSAFCTQFKDPSRRLEVGREEHLSNFNVHQESSLACFQGQKNKVVKDGGCKSILR